MTNRPNTGFRGRRLLVAVAAAALLGGVTACDTESLVDLRDPDLIELPVVVDPDNIGSVRNGALYLFAQALAGPAGNNQTPGLIGISGLLADEAWYASTFTSMRDIDARTVFDTNGDVGNVFLWLQQARNLAEQADLLYEENAPESGDRALLGIIDAYAYLLFAETFCSNVPFNNTPLAPAGGGSTDFNAGLTTTEMLNEAIARFDEAIDLATDAGEDAYAMAARIGKARALQNLGQFTEAADEVAGIPTDFVYDVEFSENSAAQNNGVWYNVNSEARTSLATEEGGNGLHFFDFSSSAPDADPRIDVAFGGAGLGTTIPLFVFQPTVGLYGSRGADVPLATGIEARLIEAEAAADGGQSAAYLSILNALRADVGLGALSDPGNPQDRMLQLYEERAFWLWMTAHRQGDLRRLIRVYGSAPYNLSGMTADNLFPAVGSTMAGRAYGDDVAFPVPDNERNNPEFNPDLCVTSDA